MSKKLVIRINNLQDLEPNDTYEPEVETIIRWDRVVTFAVLMLVILGGVGWAGWVLLKTDHSDGMEAMQVLTVAETLPEESSVQVSEPLTPVSGSSESQPQIDHEERADAAAEVPALPESEVEVAAPMVTAAETNIETSVVVVPPSEADQAEASIAEKQRVTDTVEAKMEVEVDEVSPEFPDSLAKESNPITIKSPSIARAQLTHNVKKKEPVDELGTTISMDGEGLIKIFLFTDMNGLKGETLYHSWYLGDKRMARVKINVRNDNVVASSSKFIDKYMVGQWTVKVANKQGNELVSGGFEVVR